MEAKELIKGMQVWMPNGSNGDPRMGIVIEISPKEQKQTGLICGRDKAKIRYADGHGGMSEKWIAFDKLSRVKTVKELKQAEIDAEKQKELEEVSKKDREDTEWVVTTPDEDAKKALTEQANIQVNDGSSNINKGVATGSGTKDDTEFLG